MVTRIVNRAAALSAALVTLLIVPALSAQQTVELPGRDRAIAPEPQPAYSIGSIAGDAWETFGEVDRVAFDAEGNLYVLDNHRAGLPEPAQFELDELRILPFKKTAAEINATLFSEVDPNQTIYYLRLNEPDPPENSTLREYANGWPTTLDGELYLQNFSPVFDPSSPVFEGSPRCWLLPQEWLVRAKRPRRATRETA